MFNNLINLVFGPWNNQTPQETANSHVTPTTPTAGPNTPEPNDSIDSAANEIANAILKAIVENHHRKETPCKYAVVIFESRSWLTIRKKLEGIAQKNLQLTNYEHKTIAAWLANIKLIEDNYNTIQTCMNELSKPNFTIGTVASQARFQRDQKNRDKAVEARESLDGLKTSLMKEILQQSSFIRKTSKSSNLKGHNPAFSEVIFTIYSQWSKLWAFHTHEGVTLESQTLHGKVIEITENAHYQELPLYLQECGKDVYAVKATYALREKDLYFIQSNYEDNASVGKVEPFIETFAPTSPFIGKGSKINLSYVTPSEFYTTSIDDENGVTSQAQLIRTIVASALSTVNGKLSSNSRRFTATQTLK